MRLPRLRTASLWISVLFNIVLGIALTSASLDREKGNTSRGSQPLPATRVETAKAEPKVIYELTRQPFELRFRIVNAVDKKPIGLARVVIANLNLAPELGDDSDAVTWPDGRVIFAHRFFFWAERRGDQRSGRAIFQGPWISVSADGFEPRKMPLSDLLEHQEKPLDEHGVVGFRRSDEVVVTLQPARSGVPDLAHLTGDFIYGTGFVYQHLLVSMPGRYQFGWHSDVITRDPHDRDRYESRGTCAVVDGALRLVPEGPCSSDVRRMMSNDFIPVRWDTRWYLIPEKERLDFCNMVNQGGVPKYMRSGEFLMGMDRPQPPDDRLEVPREWSPYLLTKPVTGTITVVFSDHLAIMDTGAKAGLKAGMEFVRENRLHPSWVKVLFADPDRCVVRLKTRGNGILSDSSPGPGVFRDFFENVRPLVVGEKISSRSSDPERDF